MPKLINLANMEKFEALPDFRVPKWLKPEMIADLMRGSISDTEDEDDDMVHVDLGSDGAKTDVKEKEE